MDITHPLYKVLGFFNAYLLNSVIYPWMWDLEREGINKTKNTLLFSFPGSAGGGRVHISGKFLKKLTAGICILGKREDNRKMGKRGGEKGRKEVNKSNREGKYPYFDRKERVKYPWLTVHWKPSHAEFEELPKILTTKSSIFLLPISQFCTPYLYFTWTFCLFSFLFT